MYLKVKKKIRRFGQNVVVQRKWIGGCVSQMIRGTKRLVSVDICSVEGNSADIFVSKVSPEILVVKRK